MLRFYTSGESHGKLLTAFVEGLPANIPVDIAHIDRQLARRQAGYGRGKRMEIEADTAEIVAGVRGGKTLGSPVAMLICNKDYENWEKYMNPSEIVPGREVYAPRPGHADLAGAMKYGQTDMRNILERASARETAARVAAGALVMEFLSPLGVRIRSHVVSIGDVCSNAESGEEQTDAAERSSVRCADADAAKQMMRRIDEAKEKGDTLGGVFEVVLFGLPAGLGSHIQWDLRLDAKLAGAMMSIPAVKGVEIGLGFEAARRHGSAVHDEIFWDGGYRRKTNNAGGLEGGMTNGEPVVLRCAMKPIPTLIKPLASVDIRTKEAVSAAAERSDCCAVPAAAVVGEAMAALTIAAAVCEQYGGSTLEEVLKRWKA